VRALCLPGCGCRGAFQLATVARLVAAGERFDVVAGASSGSICAAFTVAGLALEAPAIVRSLVTTPFISTRYLKSDRTIFGMGRILQDFLTRYLPESKLRATEAELLVATTRARSFARAAMHWPVEPVPGALAVHSNRERCDLHRVISASCYIPVLFAGVHRLDGEVHLDGAFADNTLFDTVVARGATEVTVVTPYPNGAVTRTMFATEGPILPPPHVRLRLLYPRRPLSIGRLDLAPQRVAEALSTPHEERVIEPTEIRAGAA
jgi:NTE family protein